MCLCLKQVLIFQNVFRKAHAARPLKKHKKKQKKPTCVRDPYQQLSGKTNKREEKGREAHRAQRAQIRLTRED